MLHIVSISFVLRLLYPIIADILEIEQHSDYLLSKVIINNSNHLNGTFLAVLGLNAFSLGYILNKGYFRFTKEVKDDKGVVTYMVILGMILLAYYQVLNFSGITGFLKESINGNLRDGSAIVSNSSRYSYLAGIVLLYAGLEYAILFKNLGKLWRFFPLIVLFLFFGMSGARIQAISPILLFFLWKLLQKDNYVKVSLGRFCSLLLVVFSGFIFSYVIYSLRSGLINDISLEGIGSYLNTFLWYELSITQQLSLATELGPFIYPGELMTWMFQNYMGYFLGVDQKPPGAFLLEVYFSRSFDWGIHTGATVDLYLQGGIIFVVVFQYLLGYLMKFLTLSMYKAKSISLSVIFLIAIYRMYWFQFESLIGFFSIIVEPIMIFLVVRMVFWSLKSIAE